MPDLIIRQARETDIDDMARLDRLCFSAPWSRESFRLEILKNHLAFYLVAELPAAAGPMPSKPAAAEPEKSGQLRVKAPARGLLAGYAGIWAILEEGHITNVAVHPDHRRAHIGEALVRVLMREAEAAGILRFTLEARVSNEAAIGLYRKLGFREAGIRKGYYEDNNEDALIMWADGADPGEPEGKGKTEREGGGVG